MFKKEIIKKFGLPYKVNPQTFIMGTHHLLANKIAKRFAGYNCVLDACTGAGFMAIAIARYAKRVIAVDINKEHLEMARENGRIVGVQDKIEFIEGDILDDGLLNKIGQIDGAQLDPDWASGDDKEIHVTTLRQMQPDGNLLFNKIYHKTHNIAMRLPKEFNLTELDNLPRHELEEEMIDSKLKFYTVYFGNLINL